MTGSTTIGQRGSSRNVVGSCRVVVLAIPKKYFQFSGYLMLSLLCAFSTAAIAIPASCPLAAFSVFRWHATVAVLRLHQRKARNRLQAPEHNYPVRRQHSATAARPRSDGRLPRRAKPVHAGQYAQSRHRHLSRRPRHNADGQLLRTITCTYNFLPITQLPGSMAILLFC